MALLAVSAMGTTDVVTADIFTVYLPKWLQWSALVSCAAMKASLWLMVLSVSRKWRWLYVISVSTVYLYAFLCLVNFICFEFYGFGISHKMLMLMSETNPSEAIDFFESFGVKIKEILSWKSVITTVTIVAIVCLIVRRLRPKSFLFLQAFTTLLGCIFFVYLWSSAAYGKNNLSILLRTVKNIVEVYRENKQLNSMMEKMQPYKHADEVVSDQRTFNLVVIFGESSDKSHMSLYGYPLPTTPVLETMSDSLVVVGDAIASSKFTADNMERMLTLKKDSDSDGWWRHPLLIDILNAAGYRTFWLSNQEKSGIWSNATSVISSRAHESRYIGKTSSEDHLLQKYDEYLIPELAQVLRDTIHPKWIGLHLIGSHFAYKNRYPEDHQHFSAEDIRKSRPRSWMDMKKYKIAANYDSSVRYTDSVVGKIFGIVARQDRPSVAIYLSDHGENVYDDRDYCGRDLKHVRVPFVVYANAAFRNAHPKLMEALRSTADKKITTANLPYSILTLTGTSCPDYNPAYDFLSPEYKGSPRYVENEPWPYD